MLFLGDRHAHSEQAARLEPLRTGNRYIVPLLFKEE